MDSLKVQIQLEVVADIGEEIFLFFFLIIVFVNVRVGCIWFISSKKKIFFFFFKLFNWLLSLVGQMEYTIYGIY